MLLAFLAMRTTLPFSPAWRPRAYSNSSQFHIPIRALRNSMFSPAYLVVGVSSILANDVSLSHPPIVDFREYKKYLAGVDVDGVQGIAGEAHATSTVALDEESVLVACIQQNVRYSPAQFHIHNLRISQSTNVRVICQTRSAETLDLSAAIFYVYPRIFWCGIIDQRLGKYLDTQTQKEVESGSRSFCWAVCLPLANGS